MSSIKPHQPLPSHLAGSPSEIAQSVCAIQDIARASDAAELLEALFRAVSAIGGTAALYVAFVPEGEAGSSVYRLFACDPEFAQEASIADHIEDHPWIRQTLGRSTAVTDRQLMIEGVLDCEHVALAKRYGFNSCYLVPTAAGRDLRRGEVLCLGSNEHDVFDRQEGGPARVLARSLAALLHDWVTSKLRSNLERTAKLRPIDVELLNLEWQRLSTKSIAQRTGMSMASVDSRFQRLITRMKCRSRREAARRAAEHGLFECH